MQLAQFITTSMEAPEVTLYSSLCDAPGLSVALAPSISVLSYNRKKIKMEQKEGEALNVNSIHWSNSALGNQLQF